MTSGERSLQDTDSRQNSFNVLRLLLASLVILSHAPELHEGNRNSELLTRLFGTLSFGELAVDGFFLLSGYLITQSWDRQPYWRVFVKKRVLRIYPAFIVASLLCALVLGPWVAATATYASDFSLMRFLKSVLTLGEPVIPPVFADRPYPYINGAMWTIRWEFVCYLAVVAVGLLRGIGFRSTWTLLTVLIVGLWIAARLTTGTSLQQWVPNLAHPLLRLGSFFLVGGCFYLYRNSLVLKGRFAMASLAMLLPCMFSWRLSEPALLVFGSYILFYVAHLSVPAFGPLNGRIDISYGIYLYGWPLQNLASSLWPQANVWLLASGVYLASISLGLASWYLVEKPFLRLKGNDHSSRRDASDGELHKAVQS